MQNLEGSRFFPLIAWTLIIFFCCGTLFLTKLLHTEVQKIEHYSEQTHSYLE